MGKIEDSGNRRTFSTGAVRDIDENKGRCDLMPLDVVGAILEDVIFAHINNFMRTGDVKHLMDAIRVFAVEEYGDTSMAMLEVSIHYKDGAEKYEERNWEKGIELHSFIDSAVRHYLKYRRGESKERHDRAFIWNLMGAIWTYEHLPEMDDIIRVREGKTCS